MALNVLEFWIKGTPDLTFQKCFQTIKENSCFWQERLETQGCSLPKRQPILHKRTGYKHWISGLAPQVWLFKNKKLKTGFFFHN